MKIHFFNSKVRQALMYDLALYACYRHLSGPYDDEIDPIHNPDYVSRSQKEEDEFLEKARNLRDEYVSQMANIRNGAE